MGEGRCQPEGGTRQASRQHHQGTAVKRREAGPERGERGQASRASPSSSPRRHGTAYGSFCRHRGGDQLVNARFTS